MHGVATVLFLVVLATVVATFARRLRVPAPSLLVVPASLIGNWTAELARFAPSLRFLVAHPSAQAPG